MTVAPMMSSSTEPPPMVGPPALEARRVEDRRDRGAEAGEEKTRMMVRRTGTPEISAAADVVADGVDLAAEDGAGQERGAPRRPAPARSPPDR